MYPCAFLVYLIKCKQITLHTIYFELHKMANIHAIVQLVRSRWICLSLYLDHLVCHVTPEIA